MTSILQISWHSLLSRPVFKHGLSWRAVGRTNKQTNKINAALRLLPPSTDIRKHVSLAVEIWQLPKHTRGGRARILSEVRVCLGAIEGLTRLYCLKVVQRVPEPALCLGAAAEAKEAQTPNSSSRFVRSFLLRFPTHTSACERLRGRGQPANRRSLNVGGRFAKGEKNINAN